jgi:nitrate reductase / nitrite oxidoreductase, alpha subunit
MTPGLDDPLTEALLRAGKYLQRGEVSDDLRTVHRIGGRCWVHRRS